MLSRQTAGGNSDAEKYHRASENTPTEKHEIPLYDSNCMNCDVV